jgi:hypothetical protein
MSHISTPKRPRGRPPLERNDTKTKIEPPTPTEQEPIIDTIVGISTEDSDDEVDKAIEKLGRQYVYNTEINSSMEKTHRELLRLLYKYEKTERVRQDLYCMVSVLLEENKGTIISNMRKYYKYIGTYDKTQKP